MIGSQLNHYKILDKLGTGGMGEVFTAEDTKLGRKVAIKILPEDLATDPERRERFEREAQTIASLNHPNIVTIYSVEEADGLHFITMELIEGKPLGEVLPDGGLTLDEFFKLSVPMVEALDAAHKKGITHRDIKPNNVMVTDEGRVKILDFGLAKLAKQESPLDATEAATMIAPSDLTEQGQILGTINYMAPEQAEGRPVDHRSDIFSLGVVLYEMATGEAPFQGETKISVITSIMRDTPPPVSEVNNELPQHLGRVVNRSLAKEPDRRYQSATDLRVELEGLKEEIATSELRQSAMNLKPEPVAAAATGGGGSLKVAAMVGGAAIIAALAYGLWPSGDGTADAPPAAAVAVADVKPSLGVLYFENLSGDENLDWLRTGLTDMLVTDLAQSPNLKVLGTDRLHQILEDIGAADDEMTSADVVSAVAAEGQVENVLLGSFARAGSMIRISARLQVAATGEILASETVEGEGEDAIFPMVDDLTKRIKAQFEFDNEVIVADVDADLTDVTTDSLEAYRFYAEGIRLHEQLRSDEAIPLLERATEIDPSFAMALAKLATSYGNIGEGAKALEFSERAMANLDRVNDRERYYIEGRHYSLDEKTRAQSIEAYQKAIAAYPDHTSARNNLAQQLMNEERFDEAIEQFETLRSSGMRFPGTYASLANAYGQMGEFDKGLEVLREYIDENPDNAAGFENLAAHLVWAGELDEAMQTVEVAEALGRPFGETAGLRWQAAVLAGDWDAAEDVADDLFDLEEPRFRAQALFAQANRALFEGDLEDFFDAADAVEEMPNYRQQGMNYRSGVELSIGDIDGLRATAERMLESAEGSPQMRLDGLGSRSMAIAATEGLDAAEESVDDLWEVVLTLGLPEEILAREERRFRGQLAFAAGEWREALTLFAVAMSSMTEVPQRGDSNRPRVHYEVGVAHFELGEHAEAEEHLLRMLTMSGRVYEPIPAVRAHWYLGQIYEQRGDNDQARRHYQAFYDFWESGEIDEERVAYAEVFLER